MASLPGKLLRSVSAATIGTAIVMMHLVLAERERARRQAESAGVRADAWTPVGTTIGLSR